MKTYLRILLSKRHKQAFQLGVQVGYLQSAKLTSAITFTDARLHESYNEGLEAGRDAQKNVRKARFC